MGRAALLRPRTRGWGRARDAIAEYVGEQHAQQRKALKLDELIALAQQDLPAGTRRT
jgi:anti-sigma factor ChrR (cupin superfamily)